MFIKRFLFALLGTEGYLKLVSRMFFFLYYSGILRPSVKFNFHYFVQKLVAPGSTVIDIGGNLGYYSVIFAKLTGEKGKVYSVEPVTLFRRILTRNTKKYKQVEIIPFALGSKDNEKVTLGIPSGHKHFRHGLTRVQQGEKSSNDYEFIETMMKPETVFGNIEKIDYIKCDVEGYEIHILPEMLGLMKKHQPLLQIETEGNNRNQITEMLKPLGYQPWFLEGKKLVPFTPEISYPTGDMLYIPESGKEKLQRFF